MNEYGEGSFGPSRHVVVIVDDDAAVRDSLRVLLRTAGLPIILRASGSGIADLCASLVGACLVLDLSLPGQDGFSIYADLVARGGRLPVICITGCAELARRARTLPIPPFAVLEKPLSDALLLDTVMRALHLAPRGDESDLPCHSRGSLGAGIRKNA